MGEMIPVLFATTMAIPGREVVSVARVTYHSVSDKVERLVHNALDGRGSAAASRG